MNGLGGICTATISECGQYRYRLGRRWNLNGTRGEVLWVMLNPSTADAMQDDPTIRRCIGYAQAWGYDGIRVANLFAIRSPDPKYLHATVKARGLEEAVGPENDRHIVEQAQGAALVMLAWGSHGQRYEVRTRYVRRLLSEQWPILRMLGHTKHLQPLHPLMQPADLKPVPWWA